MGSFANSDRVRNFSIGMACVLFSINAYGLLPDEGAWYGYILLLIGVAFYVALLVIVIREPVSNLAPLENAEPEEP